MLTGRNLLNAIAALCFLCACNCFAVNPLSSKEQKIADKLTRLEAKFKAGEVSELELTLFKARVASSNVVRLEPVLTESDQGVVRNLRMLVAADRVAALAAVLLEINDKSSPTFDFIAGSFYAERENWESAKTHFIKATSSFPNYLDAHKNLGIVSVRLKDWNTAKRSLLKAYSLQGDAVDADVCGLIGLCYATAEDWPTAELFYQKALGKTEAKDWRMGLVNALLKQGKDGKAVPVLESLYAEELLEARRALKQGQSLTGVDTQPVPLQLNVDFAAVAGELSSGYVVAEFLVTDRGNAIDARIIESSDPRFQESTLLAIRNSKWTAAMLDGEAVSVRVRKRFVFGE